MICSSICASMHSPFSNVSNVTLVSLSPACISLPTSPLPLVLAQWVPYFFVSRYMVTDQGLYMSVTLPKVNPSYQNLTCSFSDASKPWLSKAAKTSSSVNPKAVAYLSEVVVTTVRLFKSEKMDSLLTLVIPVIMAR